MAMATLMVASVSTRRLRNRVVLTFALVSLTWVFFRADSIESALRILRLIPGWVAAFVSRLFEGLAGRGPLDVGLMPGRDGSAGQSTWGWSW
jgi:hypothetical protein